MWGLTTLQTLSSRDCRGALSPPARHRRALPHPLLPYYMRDWRELIGKSGEATRYETFLTPSMQKQWLRKPQLYRISSLLVMTLTTLHGAVVCLMQGNSSANTPLMFCFSDRTLNSSHSGRSCSIEGSQLLVDLRRASDLKVEKVEKRIDLSADMLLEEASGIVMSEIEELNTLLTPDDNKSLRQHRHRRGTPYL
ncbi:hypothetical protein U9M48_042703 [Paspalum notatum var. saurae]|uniref:Uncharacterized protein n=1 Tax=Paspalum notatum var. saurae TaxID=547442 RepID=A0AAQ3UTE0_PASNO